MGDPTKNKGRKKYVLQVQRGDELNLQRIDEICNEESIMRPSYEKAMYALMQIMRRTKRFQDHYKENHYEDDSVLDDLLFSYSGNVIAFAAQRGGGKTATMLSFSKILNAGFGRHSTYCNVDNSFLNAMGNGEEEQPRAWLARSSFITMTPIAPAVLEGNQTILHVVLSRIYRYAERLIAERSRTDRVREAQKNKIIRSFQKALSGINGIKTLEKKYPGDLAGMQDICDGLSLSRHFYVLVQSILDLAASDLGVGDRYLVIQLDDADSKMQKVYEVMEDVRKYLMIPNLVILMSVDPKCMSDVVFQDNLKCFPDLLRVDQDRLPHDLSKITNKYIDKLIPPTHMVHLPPLDQIVIHWGDMLRLRYVDEDKHDVYEWMADDELDLQTSILMLIYHKTGILFVKPYHYLHNIIPRTLRGFVQLLALLDSMPSIPELNYEAGGVAYAESVLTQVEIAAANQRKFADYFKTSWINVKVTDQQDLDFLQKFADTVSANRIRLAVKYLWKCYGVDFAVNEPKYFKNKKIAIPNIREREDLDQLMWEIDQIRRTDRDFRLLFAIRTLFTLDSHQHVLKQKREAVREYLKAPNEKRVLVFGFQPNHIWVPKSLFIEDSIKKCGIKKADSAPYTELFAPLLGYDRFINAIYVMSKSDPAILTLQQLVHKMQDLAVTLYANADVTYVARTSLKQYVERSAYLDTPSKNVKVLVEAMLTLISAVNDGKLNRQPAELPGYGNRYELMLGELSRSIQDALAKQKAKASPRSSKTNKQSTKQLSKSKQDESFPIEETQ